MTTSLSLKPFAWASLNDPRVLQKNSIGINYNCISFILKWKVISSGLLFTLKSLFIVCLRSSIPVFEYTIFIGAFLSSVSLSDLHFCLCQHPLIMPWLAQQNPPTSGDWASLHNGFSHYCFLLADCYVNDFGGDFIMQLCHETNEN